MKVTQKTIMRSKAVNNYTKYIVYFPGNAEDVGEHDFQGWGWCDENTVIDLCNYPYHSEWHDEWNNSGILLGSSKSRKIFNNIIALAIFASIGSAIFFFTPLALAIPAFIVLVIAFPVTMLLVNFVVVRANATFYLRGQDSVAVGVKRVLDLLEKGVHPDNIILVGNSIGGGVAAEVYKKFESEGIYLRCQIKTSFSSIADVLVPMDNNDDKKESWRRKLLRSILKIGHWDIETYKIINSITPYTIFFNNEGDDVIKENAQLVTKVRKMEKNGENKSSQAPQDKIFELLFKKHTMLKHSCKDPFITHKRTHNYPLSQLESAESSSMSAEDLHYLAAYLPYHMDILRSEVKNFTKEKGNDNSNAENNNKMVTAVNNLLSTLDAEELRKLKGLLDEIKKEPCLNKNKNYSKETQKQGLDSLKKWIGGYNISFVDLDNPKNPDGSLITHLYNPCIQGFKYNKASLE